jgi:hypothetical protein
LCYLAGSACIRYLWCFYAVRSDVVQVLETEETGYANILITSQYFKVKTLHKKQDLEHKCYAVLLQLFLMFFKILDLKMTDEGRNM